VASPVNVANGVLYVGTNGVYDESAAGALYAINAASGSLLWRGNYGLTDEFTSSPAVANGVVYVGTRDNLMAAFDASGVTNCSGTPTTCSPLWTDLTGGNGSVYASPAVGNGIVYAGSADGNLYAYDANGVTNCSGSPKTCNPLWTGPTGSSFIEPAGLAVANGVVFFGAGNGKFYAFDANGVTNCSGTPKTCSSLWTASTGSYIESSPAVANGVVYIGSDDNKVYAFDASGATGCAGTPKTCMALSTVNTGSQVLSTPVVANGIIYVVNEFTVFAYALP
jgi:outer membrane protein assembly factor BamB